MNMELSGVKALVVGMAKSGFAAVELLKQHGADVRATDLKARDKLPPIDVPFAQQTPEVFEGADLHHTFANYVNAKARLFETQQPGSHALLNADDATCVEYATRTSASPVWFSRSRPVTPGLWLDGGRIVYDGRTVMETADVPIR